MLKAVKFISGFMVWCLQTMVSSFDRSCDSVIPTAWASAACLNKCQFEFVRFLSRPPLLLFPCGLELSLGGQTWLKRFVLYQQIKNSQNASFCFGFVEKRTWADGSRGPVTWARSPNNRHTSTHIYKNDQRFTLIVNRPIIKVDSSTCPDCRYQ